MSRRVPSWRWRRSARLPAPTLLLLVAAALSGCTSFLSNLPIVGEPSNLPQRPETTGPFPAVHDVPPKRDTKTLTEAERKQLETELTAARDKQEAETNTVPAKPPPK